MLLKTSWLSWINKMYSTANQRDESDGIIDEMVKFSRVKITIIIFFSNIESDSFEVFALENTFFSNLHNLENSSLELGEQFEKFFSQICIFIHYTILENSSPVLETRIHLRATPLSLSLEHLPLEQSILY